VIPAAALVPLSSSIRPLGFEEAGRLVHGPNACEKRNGASM